MKISLLSLVSLLALTGALGFQSSSFGATIPQAKIVTKASPASIGLTACGPVTSNTSYYLKKDITSSGTSCFDFSNTSNIVLNCNGHKISTFQSPNISMSDASNITITQCNLQPLQTGYNATYVIGNNVSNIKISNSIIGSTTYNTYQSLQFTSVDHVTITNNPSLNALVYVEYGSYITVSYNTMAAPSNSKDYAQYPVDFYYGSNNTVLHNHIDGRHDVTVPASGADDCILINQEANDEVGYNTCVNTYDVGLELTGVTDHILVHDNKISNTTLGGIGSFHYTSITNSSFINNTVSNTNYLFDIFRTGGLRPAGFDGGPMKMPADTGVYFENNKFEGNTLVNPVKYDDTYSSFIPVYAQLYNLGAVPAADFHISNNIFRDNNFTYTASAPNFGANLPDYQFVNGYVTDDGGNLCTQPTTSPYPLTCH